MTRRSDKDKLQVSRELSSGISRASWVKVMRRRDAGCGFDGCRGKVRIVVVVLYPQMKINGPSLSSSPSRFFVCSRDTRDMRV